MVPYKQLLCEHRLPFRACASSLLFHLSPTPTNVGALTYTVQTYVESSLIFTEKCESFLDFRYLYISYLEVSNLFFLSISACLLQESKVYAFRTFITVSFRNNRHCNSCVSHLQKSRGTIIAW